jgi:hypothetical protein
VPTRNSRPTKSGPRGGRTTVTASGLVRTTVHLTEREHAYLREKGYRERRTISEIIREVLGEHFPELEGKDG